MDNDINHVGDKQVQESKWLKKPSILQTIILSLCMLGLLLLIVSYPGTFKDVLNVTKGLLKGYYYIALIDIVILAIYGFITNDKWPFPIVIKRGFIISIIIALLPIITITIYTSPLWSMVDEAGFAAIVLIFEIAQAFFVAVVSSILVGSLSFIGVIIGIFVKSLIAKT